MSTKATSEYHEKYGYPRIISSSKKSVYKASTKNLEEQPVGGRKTDPVKMANAAKRVRCSLCGKYCADANKEVGDQESYPCSPVPQLPVPNVHQLRYSTNNYMSAYDWY